MNSWNSGIALLLALVFGANIANGQGPYPGWNFYNNGAASQRTLLADLNGFEAHRWTSAFTVGVAVYLLDDGKILRGANDQSVQPFSGPGVGGRIERLDWDSNVEWSYVVAGPDFVSHHDIEPLPNGNVLVTIWERFSREEAIAMGRDPNTIGDDIWAEAILELEPVGTDDANVVWEWHVWDHLIQNFDSKLPNFGDPADHPEKIDINYFNPGSQQNWLHANAIDYNAELDQIVLSSRNLHQVWIFSHAPGADGDLLYRYGNPASYGRGTVDDQVLFGAHNVHWIEPGLRGAGRLLLYNNGFDFNSPRGFSSFDEITTPLNAKLTYDINNGEPFAPVVPTDSTDMINGETFFSNIMSSAQRLPNGNTFVCQGRPGLLHELDRHGNTVWSGNVPQITFRTLRVGTYDSRLEGYIWESMGNDLIETQLGELTSGGLVELSESDDTYVTARRNEGPIEMTIKGTIDNFSDLPRQLNLTLESKHVLLTDERTPRVVVDRKIELFNYDTNEFEFLAEERSNILDRVLEVQVDENSRRFIEPGTGCVEARLTFTRVGLARRMRILLDHFDIRVVD